jgi:hypothetical protein
VPETKHKQVATYFRPEVLPLCPTLAARFVFGICQPFAPINCMHNHPVFIS